MFARQRDSWQNLRKIKRINYDAPKTADISTHRFHWVFRKIFHTEVCGLLAVIRRRPWLRSISYPPIRFASMTFDWEQHIFARTYSSQELIHFTFADNLQQFNAGHDVIEMISLIFKKLWTWLITIATRFSNKNFSDVLYGLIFGFSFY